MRLHAQHADPRPTCPISSLLVGECGFTRPSGLQAKLGHEFRGPEKLPKPLRAVFFRPRSNGVSVTRRCQDLFDPCPGAPGRGAEPVWRAGNRQCVRPPMPPPKRGRERSSRRFYIDESRRASRPPTENQGPLRRQPRVVQRRRCPKRADRFRTRSDPGAEPTSVARHLGNIAGSSRTTKWSPNCTTKSSADPLESPQDVFLRVARRRSAT